MVSTKVHKDFYLLALHRLLMNNPAKLVSLLAEHGEASRIVKADPKLAGQVDLNIERAVMADLEWLERPDHHLITIGDEDYPSLLKHIVDPPPLLFAKGQRELMPGDGPRLAMVGARKASRYGVAQAERIARDLSNQGVTIVSGMALGIDGAAHDGALQGATPTIAVLGTGCDQVYPRRHWRLAEQISQEGMLVSEFPVGTTAWPGNFPRRNRIVVGMCTATLVIEAAIASGSLISARLALAEGRDVMAMPGLVTSRGARGCHQLIRDGAVLIEQSTDVLAELGMVADAPQLSFNQVQSLSEAELALMATLAEGPKSIDELIEALAVPVDMLTVTLVSLEVNGLVISEAGMYQQRVCRDA